MLYFNYKVYIFTPTLFTLFIVSLVAGKRGLEIRGHGAGSVVPVDFHHCCYSGNGRHYSTCAHTLRHPCPDRHQDVRDSNDYC